MFSDTPQRITQLNTTPSGNSRLGKKEPNRKKCLQKRRANMKENQRKRQESAAACSSMLRKQKLLSICFTTVVKTLQHFSNIICLEYITQHVPEIKKLLLREKRPQENLLIKIWSTLRKTFYSPPHIKGLRIMLQEEKKHGDSFSFFYSFFFVLTSQAKRIPFIIRVQ